MLARAEPGVARRGIPARPTRGRFAWHRVCGWIAAVGLHTAFVAVVLVRKDAVVLPSDVLHVRLLLPVTMPERDASTPAPPHVPARAVEPSAKTPITPHPATAMRNGTAPIQQGNDGFAEAKPAPQEFDPHQWEKQVVAAARATVENEHTTPHDPFRRIAPALPGAATSTTLPLTWREPVSPKKVVDTATYLLLQLFDCGHPKLDTDPLGTVAGGGPLVAEMQRLYDIGPVRSECDITQQ